MRIAIVGATGLVGREIKRLLDLPATSITRETLPTTDWSQFDLAFFATDSATAKAYIPHVLKTPCHVIDSSSAFRGTAPLIIPEINGHLADSPLISSPNCTASIMLMALYPLHQHSPITQIIASTYQAVSGAGQKTLQSFLDDPLAFPLHLHPDNEEEKMIFETRKILEKPDLPISVRCVRVPVLRAHCLSLHVSFAQPIPNAHELLKAFPGVKLKAHPTPHDAFHQHDIFCDVLKNQENVIELWVVGDQLLKGAALNAVQIFQCKTALHCT